MTQESGHSVRENGAFAGRVRAEARRASCSRLASSFRCSILGITGTAAEQVQPQKVNTAVQANVDVAQDLEAFRQKQLRDRAITARSVTEARPPGFRRSAAPRGPESEEPAELGM